MYLLSFYPGIFIYLFYVKMVRNISVKYNFLIYIYVKASKSVLIISQASVIKSAI